MSVSGWEAIPTAMPSSIQKPACSAVVRKQRADEHEGSQGECDARTDGDCADRGERRQPHASGPRRGRAGRRAGRSSAAPPRSASCRGSRSVVVGCPRIGATDGTALENGWVLTRKTTPGSSGSRPTRFAWTPSCQATAGTRNAPVVAGSAGAQGGGSARLGDRALEVGLQDALVLERVEHVPDVAPVGGGADDGGERPRPLPGRGRRAVLGRSSRTAAAEPDGSEHEEDRDRHDQVALVAGEPVRGHHRDDPEPGDRDRREPRRSMRPCPASEGRRRSRIKPAGRRARRRSAS